MLNDLLSANRAAVLKRWRQLILDTYPPDVARFISREQDRFMNPVGYVLSNELGTIYDQIVHGLDTETLSASLDNVIKIRAIQEFSPSQAVSFVFLLKRAIAQELGAGSKERQLLEELLGVYSRIDEAALRAFDLHVRRREKVYEIRANEARRRSERILERMNELYGIREEEPELDQP